MNTEKMIIESDEDGFHLIVSTSIRKFDFLIDDPEEFYDAVKMAIWPWLYEKYEAQAERRDQERFAALDPTTAFPGDGPYVITDPKHPDHLSAMAEIFDSREGK